MHKALDLGTVIAAQVRRYRLAKNWSMRQLAEECERLGAPQLTAPSLTNIERGQDPEAKRPGRRVLVEELLVLAAALDVPPLALVVPLDGSLITITPQLSATSMDVVTWFEGRRQPGHPLPAVGFMRAAAPLIQYSAISNFLDQARSQDRGASRSKSRGETESVETAIRARDQNLQNAAHMINALVEAGMHPPALPRRWFDIMTSKGWLERPDYVPVIDPEGADIHEE